MKRKLSVSAKVGAEIRKILQEKYPTVKFIVKSRTFSIGLVIRIEVNEVRVSWLDGPKKDDVEKLIYKYKYGHFDGMTDSYVVDAYREDIDQVKYLIVYRGISDKAFKEISEKLGILYGVDFKNDKEVRAKTGHYPLTLILREFKDMDYTKEVVYENNK